MTRTRIPLLTSGAVAVTALLVGAIAAAVDPPPAMFRFVAAHTGIAPGPAGPALSGLRWKFATKGPVRSSPTLSGGRVFFGSGDGFLYALDASSGAQRWKASVGGAVASSPAVSGAVVVAAAREGVVGAFDVETGRPLWRFAAGKDAAFAWDWDFWLSSPAVSGKTVFIGAGDGNVYALELASGRKLWQFSTGGRVRSTPAVADGVVYVGSMDGRLYALDVASGRKIWAFETEGVTIDVEKAGFDRRSIVSSPAVAESLVYIGSRDAHLYAVDRKTGTLRWRFGHKIDYLEGNPEVSWVLGSPALSGGLVLTGSSDGHFFNALTAEAGSEVWRFKTPKNVFSSGSLAGGQVFFGCEDGNVFSLDAKTGRERWRFRTGAPVITSPAVAADTVYFGSDDGNLYALATGPERAGARTRRGVYWKDGGKKWFQGDVAVKDDLVTAGFELLADAEVARWLGDDSQAPSSVIVVAGDSLPADAFAGAPDATPFRKFLAAGGRIVWLGLPPDCFERDPQSGKTIRFDPSRSTRLLGVRQELGKTDWMGATATAEGRRWGMPDWYIGGLGVPPADVTTVLGLDEWGLATAWVKSFGGPSGSGFVRLWGRTDPIPDTGWIVAVAEHAE